MCNSPRPSKEDARLIAIALRRQQKTHQGRIGYRTGMAKYDGKYGTMPREYELTLADAERELAKRYKEMAEFYEEWGRDG